MTSTNELLNNFIESKKILDKQLREKGQETVKEIFKEVFSRNEGLKVVAVQGYTPGFNDGEPCEHSHQWFVGIEKGYSEKEPDFAYNDIEDFYEAFKYNEEVSKTSHINEGCKDLKKVLEEVQALDYIIEMVFGTNFNVIISLQEDGSVDINKDDYDCGY